MQFVSIVQCRALVQGTVSEAEPGAGSRVGSLGCVRLQSAAAVLSQMDAGEAAVKRLGLAGAEEEKAVGLEEEDEEDEEEEERSESEPDDAEVSTMHGMTEAANIAIAESLPNSDDGEAAPFAGRFNTHECPDNTVCLGSLKESNMVEKIQTKDDTCRV